MARRRWTPETPWVPSRKKTQAYWPPYVCRNPSCPSRGKSHPNCACGPPSLSTQYRQLEYARGGTVGRCKDCEAHEPGCEFYAEGGPVAIPSPAPLDNGQQDDTASTLGHAAITHGLIGLLEGIGDPYLSDPEKHARTIEDAKNQYVSRLNGSREEPKNHGGKLADSLFSGDHEKSAEIMQNHALIGDAGKATTKSIMGRLARPMLEQETDPEAFRGASDYLHSSARGSKYLDEECKSLMEAGKPATHMQEMSRETARKELMEKLDGYQVRPAQMLDIGGSLGHYLPTHAAQLGATAATAVNYLNGLKPKRSQNGPLDEVSNPDPVSQDAYHRQLDIANHPLMILDHIKDGTLQPQDMHTMQTIFPGLHKSMQNKITEALITAKSEEKEIPYKHKIALSIALGQPLDSTMSQPAMAAIIHSAPMSPQSNQPGKKGTGKIATAATQKTIAKVDSMYATPEQSSLLSRKS